MARSPTDKDPRLTLQSMKVLQVFLGNLSDSLSGSDIRKVSNLSTGTLYPILLRFEEAGWLESRWEKVNPSEVGRPRKRLYRITTSGQKRASQAFTWIEQGAMA